MAILQDISSAARKTSKTIYRNTTRCLKLTQDEARLLDGVSTTKGVPKSEWMRDVILRELRTGAVPDVLLAEVLGIRLLLVNVLRPLTTGQKLTSEGFDKLVDDISRAKYELATKLTNEKRRLP